MKQAILAILLLGSIVGGATVFGLGRQNKTTAASSEIVTKVQLAERLLPTEPAKAITIIDELALAGHDPGEQGRLVQIRALDRQRSFAEVVTRSDEFLTKYPKSAAFDEVKQLKLASALSSGSAVNSEVAASAEQFATTRAGTPEAVRLQAALAKKDIESGDHASAAKRLSGMLSTARMDDPAVFEVATLVGANNLARLFSAEAAPGDTVHEVRSGESINVIARKNGVTDELLLKVNNISDPRRLRVGQKLRVPAVKFSLEVDRPSNTMILRNNGEFFKVYSVRTGREEEATPVGEFRVLNKKKAPTWRPGNGHVYGPTDPNNELGTRWMAFEGDILGIHGTLHPDTIGNYASNGCVGMITAEVEELFDLITVGTPLTIKGTRDLERHRVIPPPTVPPPVELASR